MKAQIKLKTIQDVKEFIDLANQYDADVTIQSGRYIVDGKSIMGIFSLDLMKPLIAECYKEEFIKAIERFVE